MNRILRKTQAFRLVLSCPELPFTHGNASITQLAPGLQEVVRTALKEVLPDAVEKAIASGGKTRAERATEQATKKEREAREEVVKHEATIASMQARLIALEDRLEAAEDAARKAQAGRVKAESLLQDKAAECERALSILNRTYDQGPSPASDEEWRGTAAMRAQGFQVSLWPGGC